MKVAPQDLPRFITEQGGIEEIKRAVAVSEETLAKREQRQQALNDVKANAEIAEINPLTSASLNPAASYGQYAVLIAKPGEDGVMNVVAVLHDAEACVVEAIFKRIAKEELQAKEEAQAREKEIAGFVYPLNTQASNDCVQQEALAA
jgi:hypothetical protein